MKKSILLLAVFLFGLINLSRAQWQPIPSNTTHNLVDICFVNDSTGFIISSAGEVLKTTDTGNNWSLCTTLSGTFTSICHVGNDTIFAGGNAIYKSYDCGSTWQLMSNPGFGIYDLYYFNSAIGICEMGGSTSCSFGSMTYNMPLDAIESTINSGQIWTYTAGYGGMYRFQVVDDSTCYFIMWQSSFGYHCDYGQVTYKLYKSINRGQNWTYLYLTQEIDGNRFSFIDNNTAYFCSSNHKLFKSTNGGTTLNQLCVLPTFSVSQLLFINDSVGYMIGDRKIYKNGSSVLVWNNNYTGSTWLNMIYKANDQSIFVIGENGLILKENPDNIIGVPSNQAQTFAISPNPATSQITVTNYNFSPSDKTTITIFNLSGEQMISELFEGKDRLELDVCTLSKGLYVVKIQNAAGMVCKKLVIE